MIRIKNKFIAAFIVSTLVISSISVVIPNNENIVHAAESGALRDAKAKISHLTKSLKTNYLGLKNQATWEKYIEQSIDLISNIPDSEWEQREALSLEIDRAIALVSSLARINHVEKSIAPKSEGGYGNYLGWKLFRN